MRKVLISLGLAGAALGVATPAAAQYYPAPQPYGYNQPYGYGYNNGRVNFGQVRALQVRVDHIQRQITQLARQRLISRNEYRERQDDARDLERRLHRDARDGRGLSPQELYQIERRIVRLEQRIARDVADGNRRGYRRY